MIGLRSPELFGNTVVWGSSQPVNNDKVLLAVVTFFWYRCCYFQNSSKKAGMNVCGCGMYEVSTSSTRKKMDNCGSSLAPAYFPTEHTTNTNRVTKKDLSKTELWIPGYISSYLLRLHREKILLSMQCITIETNQQRKEKKHILNHILWWECLLIMSSFTD